MQPTQSPHTFWLNFHGLGAPGRELPPGEEEYWIEGRVFADILDAVRGRDDVAITFDDSNESDYTIALPLLKERKMKARFFVVARRMDEKGSLTKQQIRTMLAEGMAIENHGMEHRNWMQLDDGGLRRELVEARDLVQQVTGALITEAACPFGGYNRRVLRALRNSGYAKVYTSDRGVARTDAWIQPRITIRRCNNVGQVAKMCAPGRSHSGGLLRQAKLFLKRWR